MRQIRNVMLIITVLLVNIVLSTLAFKSVLKANNLQVSIDRTRQTEICEVDRWEHDVVQNKCAIGQKVVFLPRSFGNAQLPIYFVAANCDMRYSIALTEGGAACIYKPMVAAPASSASKSPTTQSPNQ